MVYIGVREDQSALIFDGPFLGDFAPEALTSSSIADVTSHWEWPILANKREEFPAIRQNAHIALDRVEAYHNGGRRLLDYGCGGGVFLNVAKERQWEVYGLEPLVGHAIHARGFAGATVIADTLRSDTFPLGYFDAVTAFQVFEHLPDPRAEMSKLASFTRAGGTLLIEVPNIDTPMVRLLGPRHRHFVQDHLNFFSAHTLRMLMKQHGFDPLETYYPRRVMTWRHLVSGWGGVVYGDWWRRRAANVLRRLGIADRTVSVGVGDIVAVIARKRQP